VAQHRNLLFALYDITTRPGLYHTDHLVFTHAWLPEEAFDEVAVQGRWFFARKAEAYLGLWCDRRTEWRHEGGGPGPRNEVIARGSHSSWLCRLGRAAEDGGFADFRSAISQAGVITRRDRILFDDPSLGRVEFGRTGPLLVEGRPQPLRDYPRYDSPWASAGFPATEVRLSCLGEKLTIGPSFSS
jgi:hypothetical protein